MCQKLRNDNMKQVALISLLWLMALVTHTASHAGFAQSSDPLSAYIDEGLQNNLALKQRSLDLDKSLRAMQEARGMFFPDVSIQARYSRAGGGRTILFPVGDLLNPVYGTLNEMLLAQGEAPQFPSLDNQEIDFLRSREQETVVRVIQPLYQPAILHNYRLQNHLSSAQEAELEAYKAVLTRDIKVAYYTYQKAEGAVEIFDAALELVDENVRVNERLLGFDRVTRDAVLRARSERLAVVQQHREAEKDRDLARSYFNFLLNRPLDTQVEASDESALIAQVAPPSLIVPISMEQPVSTRQYELKQRALNNRYELKQLDAALRASESAIDISKSAFLPGVSLAMDVGIQGENYAFAGESSFYMASVVLSWNLFNGFQQRSRLQQARIDHQRLRTQYDELEQQIQLQVQEAYDNMEVSLESLRTAEERLATSEEGYRIVSRQYDEGLSNQVTFLDARTTLTEAELNLNITRYDVLIRKAELEYASAIAP